MTIMEWAKQATPDEIERELIDRLNSDDNQSHRYECLTILCDRANQEYPNGPFLICDILSKMPFWEVKPVKREEVS